MADTSIQWTQKTWNPVTGCVKISPGCKRCYAETIAERFWAKQYSPNPDGTPRQFTDVRTHADRLDQPTKWRKPSRIFVNSMSDLFHEDVPFEFIDIVFAEMALALWHTYQVLTKRAARMLEYFTSRNSHLAMTRCFNNFKEYAEPVGPWPLPNVWLGVSVENQKYADERIPLLLQTPAAVRWISAEPLLGPIDLERGGFSLLSPVKSPTGKAWPGLNWVVVGGESGAGARPIELTWARTLRDQCAETRTAFFMKQLGGVRDSRGELDDFPDDLRIREYPEVTA